MTSRSQFAVMIVALALAAALSMVLYFKDVKQSDTIDIKQFPRTIQDWTSEELPISKEDLAILETDNAFVRRYRNSQGESVYLYIVYSQTNRKVSHPPEICYTGGGFTILENAHDTIPVSYKNLNIAANRLLLEGRGFHQVSFYWFKAGPTLTANYFQQQLSIATHALWAREGSALIRVSADIVHNDKDSAIRTVKRFTNVIAPLLFEYLP